MRLLPGSLLAVTLILTGAARADTVSSYYFFGDSLTDEGRNGRTAPVIWAEVLRNDLSITSGQNFAIGGATSGNQASAVLGNSGFLGQVNNFVAGAPYANAAAGVWIGTNDVQLGSVVHVPAAVIAATATQNVRNGLTAIGAAGIGTVSLLGVYDLSLTNSYELANAGTPAVRGNAALASQLYNGQLASLAVAGVKIQYYDIANFINQLQVNARAYGFTQILPLQPGQTCNAICQQTSIFDDTIHLSSRAQALIGDYVASGNPIYNAAGFAYGAIESNLESSAAAASLAQHLAGAAADQFTGSLLDRLDATRGLAYPPVGGSSRSNPWTVYAYGGAAGGTFAQVGSPFTFQGDLDATLTGVTAGAEYRTSPAVRFGAAFNYAHSDVKLESAIGARTRIDSFQGALYASATYPRLFVDGIVAGGSASLDQTRDGTFGSLHASPNAALFTATGRVGYLVPVGPAKVGPVGGLLYARTSVGGTTETGESFYAIGNDRATTSSFYGQGGAELRLTDPSFLLIDPFLTVTYNRQFDRGTGILGSYLAFLPTQTLSGAAYNPNLDFVKVAVGSTFELGPRWYGTVTAFGLKGQDSLAAGGGNVGLAYRF